MATDNSTVSPMNKTIRLSPEDRAYFMSQYRGVADRHSCWLWQGGVDADGYGIFYANGCTYRATHIALQLSGEPRPGEASALHSCDTPACVRPTHLRWGTQTQNVRDMDERQRRVPPKGSRHGLAKLTEDDVRAIRSSPLRSGLLAEQYGVKAGTIRDIRGRRRDDWSHV